MQNDLPNIQKILLSYIISENKAKSVNLTAILKIAQELFIAVAPNKWEKLFMKIWKTIIIPDIEDIKNYDERYKFINKGLKYLSNKSYITEIISDCLSRRTVAIDYLYHLEGVRRKRFKVDEVLRTKIDLFVSEISTAEDFTIVGNIYPLLTAQNIAEISAKIIDMQGYFDIGQKRYCYIAHFAKKSNQNAGVVRTLLLEHKN